ncbi:MAG: hypothetical protein V4760_02400 [Bdellovibrionota bacterium]
MRQVVAAVILISSIASTLSSSRASAATWSVFAGAGEAFALPGTIRLGYNDWEFGLLSPGAIGAVKSFRDGNWYATFGPTLHTGSTGLGLSTGAGWQPALFWGFRFRAEVLAYSVHTGVTKAEALVGLSFIF